MVSKAPVQAAKKKAVKAKVPAKSNHPKTSDMVIEAVTTLNEKGGSSLQAIKKYLAEVHKVDIGRNGTFILKAIKNLTLNEKLTQTKGKGANGSFKLPVKPKAAAPKKVKSPSKKAAKPKKATAGAKKSIKPKAVKKSPAKKAVATTTKKVAAKRVKEVAPAPVEVKKAPAAKLKKPAAVKKTMANKSPMTLKAKASPVSKKKTAPKKK